MKDSNPFEAPKESPGKIDEPLDAAEEQTDNIGFTAQMVRLTAVLCIVVAALNIRSASRTFSWLDFDQGWSLMKTFAVLECAIAIGFGITAYCCWKFSNTLISVASDREAEQSLVESQAYVWMSVILMFFLYGLNHVVGILYFYMKDFFQ